MSLTKILNDGSYGWTRTFASERSNAGKKIAIDADDNILMVGGFRGTVDFDPTEGVDIHISHGESPYYDTDIFMTKLTADGSYGWTFTMGTPTDPSGNFFEMGNDVAVDADRNIVMVGAFHNTLDFNPGDGVEERISNGEADSFVLKLTPPEDESACLDGDINCDGTVNLFDFAIFAEYFGECEPFSDPVLGARSDLDDSGCINLLDFAIFAGLFGDAGNDPSLLNFEDPPDFMSTNIKELPDTNSSKKKKRH